MAGVDGAAVFESGGERLEDELDRFAVDCFDRRRESIPESSLDGSEERLLDCLSTRRIQGGAKNAVQCVLLVLYKI